MNKVSFLLSLLLVSAQIDASGLTTVKKDTSSPGWMRNAVIYGIKPSGFTNNSSYKTISAKLQELKSLGINTIWMQPVFKTKQGGQGYDVIDFFSLREDLGPAQDLKDLISAAHRLNIRILFDFVPNHTSAEHPYAKDIMLKGDSSPYYDYYQHDNDHAPYSSYYHKDSSGFIYYFWKNLFNLNFNNEKVKKMIIDACVYWVKEYDIDGYRLDAVWAVNARAPDFGKQLRSALRKVKPDVLLLAEDKGADNHVYEKGYDAAYDWTADTTWVSHWSWQYQHHERNNFTVFNHPDISKRYSLLRESLFSNVKNNHRILRFIENNDLPRFINAHSLQQTKMAASLLFALPGIPLIYNGQEAGVRAHPYSRRPIFSADSTIRERDSFGLFGHYQNLVSGRLSHPSLTSKNIKEIKIAGAGSVIAFHRWENKEHFIILINIDSLVKNSLLVIDKQVIKKELLQHGYFEDILNGERFNKNRSESFLKVPMQGYSVRWLLLKQNL